MVFNDYSYEASNIIKQGMKDLRSLLKKGNTHTSSNLLFIF